MEAETENEEEQEEARRSRGRVRRLGCVKFGKVNASEAAAAEKLTTCGKLPALNCEAELCAALLLWRLMSDGEWMIHRDWRID